MRFPGRGATIRAICAALPGSLLFASASGAAPAPAEAFAALPAISDVDLSPLGNAIAWADRSGVEAYVVIVDVASGAVKHRIATGKEFKLRELAWSDDDTLLVTLSKTRRNDRPHGFSYEVYRTLAIDFVTGKGHGLLMADGARPLVTGADLLAKHTAKPKTVIMSSLDYDANMAQRHLGSEHAGHRGDSGWIVNLYEVDTRTGKGTPIEQGTQFTDEYVIDKFGHCVARGDWNQIKSIYRVLAKDGTGWREIYGAKRRGDMTLKGVSDDGKAVIALGPDEAGKRVLWEISVDGSGRRVLFANPEGDLGSVITDRFDGTVVGVSLGAPDNKIHWFHPADEARYNAVLRAFQDRSVRVYGRTQDGKRVVARVESPSHPAIYYLVDFDKHTADTVGEEYPALNGIQLGEMRPIHYPARDGTSIPAYLTVPPNIEAKQLPLVVLPHGGPDLQDDYQFDWWAQFLAARGYAVLQPQFRGSTGHGEAFRRAGERQWGRLMQDDVTDGVRSLIQQGTADPNRICIMGLGYGGYAALAGAVFTTDLYRCAASVNGISDLPQILWYAQSRYVDGDESNFALSFLKSIGPAYDPAVFERSPVNAIDRIQIPILLLHGVDDTRVPIEQSVVMAREMTKHHKTVTFVKIPGEDHFLSRAETRLQALKEIEKFLAANL